MRNLQNGEQGKARLKHFMNPHFAHYVIIVWSESEQCIVLYVNDAFSEGQSERLDRKSHIEIDNISAKRQKMCSKSDMREYR